MLDVYAHGGRSATHVVFLILIRLYILKKGGEKFIQLYVEVQGEVRGDIRLHWLR